jgi:hypothetical protein
MKKAWRVVVYVEGEEVLEMGPDWQAGKSDLDTEEEEALREAAESLTGFVGPPGSAFIISDDDGELPMREIPLLTPEQRRVVKGRVLRLLDFGE